MPEQRMFGLWSSPVTAKSLSVSLRLGEPCWDNDGQTLGWVEGRSDRGGIVIEAADGGATRDLTTDLSVRAFVGYGGGDFTLSHGYAYFVGQADQRIYRQPLAGGTASPITPAFGAASSPVVSPDGRWVAYVHTYEDVDSIAIVDSEGKAWPQHLAAGRDFYMQPAWHPAGDRLAWVEWDHPNMPWDGTEARIGELSLTEGQLPSLARVTTIAGAKEISILQPAFTPDGKAVVYVSDEWGQGQICRRELASDSTTQLTTGDGDFGKPAWAQGQRSLAVLSSGRVVGVRNIAGFDRLTLVESDGRVVDLGDRHEGYTVLGHPVASPSDERVVFVASGGQLPPRVIVVDLSREAISISVRRRSDSESVPSGALSRPEAISWPSFDGEQAHGIYFPPASERFEGTGAPPLLVMIHGGPTSQVQAGWNSQAQYFATRGYGVLCPNYRGSTGYGREYMLKLRASWGIYDVQDSKWGAQALVERGLADASRLVIMGGSAGGFTVLQSLCDFPGFYKAGISSFGVANQFTLASDTHKFEAHYLDSIIGPLPEAAALYRERSPIFHAHKIKDPVAVFQGDIDRVVPREQSDSIVASLRARGVPHLYHVYEGEGHGWRKTETIEHFYQAIDSFLKQYVLFA